MSIVYAEYAATCIDFGRGGTSCPSVHARGNRIKGRCLAAQGKMNEAQAAFEAMASESAEVGWFMLEVLATRDMKVLVFDKDGRGDEGSARLKSAIHRLLGESIDRDKLAASSFVLDAILPQCLHGRIALSYMLVCLLSLGTRFLPSSGAAPSAEQLAELAPTLSDGIDLSEVLCTHESWYESLYLE